ncbi:hypothetical protein G6F35_019137 [Rhizopus arrhizus]|nr:hypothetical protein G6F35_019137 [Rhizopus arrhizus]
MAASARAAISGSTPLDVGVRRTWSGTAAVSPLIALPRLPRRFGVGRMAAGLVWQAQMFTQGLPLQLVLVIAARLQDRQHLGHEIVQAFA